MGIGRGLLRTHVGGCAQREAGLRQALAGGVHGPGDGKVGEHASLAWSRMFSGRQGRTAARKKEADWSLPRVPGSLPQGGLMRVMVIMKATKQSAAEVTPLKVEGAAKMFEAMGSRVAESPAR
jgi:hypothetical protein